MADRVSDKKAGTMGDVLWIIFLALNALLFLVRLGVAQTMDLTEMSIEALMNIQVTSVNKTAQHLYDSAAAIFVITKDDLRRSGVTTIADALRMVPGLSVAPNRFE